MLTSRVGSAVALATVLLTAVAAAQPVVAGRAIFSYQVFDDQDISSHGLHQIYDANYDRTVLDPLRLRLSFRGEGADTTFTNSGTSHKTSYWLLQPGGEVDYNLPKLNFQARYDLYETKSSTDALDGARRQERGFESLVWSPDRAPSLALQAYQTGNRDVAAGIDENENRFLESLNYLWRGFTFTQTAHYADFRQGQSGFDRRTLDLQGQIRFDGSLADGRASMSAYAIAGSTRLDETSSGAGTVNAPTQAPIAAALYSQDDTPLDARDKPPVADVQLIDGNFSRRTDIGLGPSAPLYQNLVFDMGRVLSLDTFRISVRDPAGNFVPVRGLLRWDVFTSGDALDWTPIAGGAQTNFLLALSAYEVTFPKTSSRWFKIVSFGTSSADCFVTELQAFFHTEFSQGERRRTDVRFLSGSVDVAVRPLPWLAFRYYGLVNAYGTTQPDRPDYNSRDADHQVSLLFAPDKPLNATIRYEHRGFSSAGTADQTLDGYWGVVQWAVNRNLQTSLEASRTSEHGSEELVANTLRLHEYLRLFRAIELSFDGGIQREEFALQKLSGRHLFANAVGYFQLTKAVRLTLLANFEKTRFTGEGTAALTDLEPSNARYYGEVSYRPSSQLALTGRLGYVTGSQIAATTKTYRVEWYPFARGTIGIGTVYDEDVETNGSYRRFRRIQVLPTWQVNRSLTLGANYTYLRLLDQSPGTPSGVESNTKQLYVTLAWTL